MRGQLNTRLIPLVTVEVSGGLGQTATRYRCVFRVPGCSAPTFLPPFAQRPLRRFIATTEALTPVRLSPTYRSPCFTYSPFLTIPSPTTLCSPVVALYPLPCSQLDRSPISRPFAFSIDSGHRQNGSRLRHSLAGSPKPPGRNGFVILRTGRSPPVALHPASRRRSYSRLQAVAYTWRGLAPLCVSTPAGALGAGFKPARSWEIRPRAGFKPAPTAAVCCPLELHRHCAACWDPSLH